MAWSTPSLISWGTVLLQQSSNYPKSTTVLSEDSVCFTLKRERRRARTWLESGVRVFFVFVFCLVWVSPPEALCWGNLSVKMEGGNEASFWRLTSFKICKSCNSKSGMEIECVWRASDPPECRLIR